ncbi:MAG: hypothetical protein ACRC2T_02695 [Thermoguttaceae bacterium]
MKNIVKSVLFALIGLVCCSEFAVAQHGGPIVEFVNQESFSIHIAVSGWWEHRSEPSSGRGPATSSLAVMPGRPFEWVEGWYTINPGDTVRLNRGYSGFYYTWNTWGNRTDWDWKDAPYFWVRRSYAFRTERERAKNNMDVVIVFENQEPTASDKASLPNKRASWEKNANGSYKNSIEPVKSEKQLSDNGFEPFPFRTVPEGIKRVVFANGKSSYQK